MRKSSLPILAVALWLGSVSPIRAAETPEPPKVREIFVPFADLNVLLEHEPQRMMLSRREYDDLLKRATKAPEAGHAPHTALLVAADYAVTIQPQRAQLTGTLKIDVLEPGLHTIPLDLGGVGLLAANLDQRSAAIGRPDGGRPVLLVEGVGRRELTLKMVAPVETTAARQTLTFRLPRPPAAQMRLSVPGDVELKGGADVVSRAVDPSTGLTRFELLPRPGDTTLVLTLNSHLQRQQQAVVARSVLIDEITQAYEKLHATISLAVLHRAVDRFRFVVPEPFEIMEVTSPLLARWSVENQDGRRVLNVQLREQTTDTVVLGIAALSDSRGSGQWQLKRLEPLDVLGEVTVVGLLMEDRLEAKGLSVDGLIPIDTAVLRDALPATVARPAPGTPPLRALAAYYAPQGRFAASARFDKPSAETAVTTNVLLILEDRLQQVRGGLAILPKVGKLFAFDFTVPPEWHLTSVTTADEKPLTFERYEATQKQQKDLPKGTSRIRVRLPQGIAVGQEYRVYFHASRAPAEWLTEWDAKRVEFPRFAVLGAARDEGAIAVEARDDMTVSPAAQPQQLTPLNENEKAKYGLAGVATNLAYRYADPAYQLALTVEHTPPRLTARTFSFAVIKPDALSAHYELIYNVAEARVRKLSFLLPQHTPAALSIKGLGDVRVKEYVSERADENRRWTVSLEDARRGVIRLVVDFDQPLTPSAGVQQALPSPVPGEGPGVRAQGSGVGSKSGSRDDLSASAKKAGADNVPPGSAAVSAATQRVPGGQDARAPAGDKAPSRQVIQKGYSLPIVQAEGVAYQSGLVTVEGSAELDVDLPQGTARRVDVGELVDAQYQPGRRLLGVFEFVGDPPRMAIDIFRRPGYPLYPAIIERAELSTYVSRDGTSQTQAIFRLRTKAPYLELRLPGEGQSELWSVLLDGTPMKPQREAQSVLVSLPATGGVAHELDVVYATSAQPLSFGGKVKMSAPKLFLRADRDTTAEEVPLGDLYWHLHLPDGYEVMRSGGTVISDEFEKPPLGAVQVAAALYWLAGGIEPFYWAAAGSVRESARRTAALELADREEEAAEADYKFVRKLGEPPAAADAEISPDAVEHYRESLERRKAKKTPSAKPEAAGRPETPATRRGSGAQAINSLKMGEASKQADKLEQLSARLKAGGEKPAEPQPRPRVASGEESKKKEGGGLIGSVQVEVMPELDILVVRGHKRDVEAVQNIIQEVERLQVGRLQGVRSLRINLDQAADFGGQAVTFRSLGVEPELAVTLANWPRFEALGRQIDALGFGLALVVILIGLAMTNQPVGRKVRLVIVVGVLATLIPLAFDNLELARVCNMLFYAASLLVPYYLLAGLVKWSIGAIRRMCSTARPSAAAAATMLLLAACLLPATAAAQTAQSALPPSKSGTYLLRAVEPPEPVNVPEDAIIVPYDPASKKVVAKADRLLVPYAKYVELWNRAYPDKKIGTTPAPVPYALAGAAYSTTLEGEDSLLISGRVEIDVWADGYVSIPLGLGNGVLSRAELDGKAARLSIAQPLAEGASGVGGLHDASAFAPPSAELVPPGAKGGLPGSSLLLLHVSGKGRHSFELEVRMRLARQGGWRMVEGLLPAAPASSLSITVPQPQTELRLGQAADRFSGETHEAGEKITTALLTSGAVSIQWRPKLAEAEVDRSLTAQSTALLDVQEDGLRLVWRLALQFPRSQREQFTLSVPKQYFVEKVEGGNVRGWQTRPADEKQTVEITLLKPAKDQEEFTLHLSRNMAVGRSDETTEFDVPPVGVSDAALSSGELTIRRSPVLELRTLKLANLTRIDMPSDAGARGGLPAPADAQQSPLGIKPYQAYRFVSGDFTLRLAAQQISPEVTAMLQTVLKIAEYQRNLESRINLQVQGRPIYRVALLLPEQFRLDQVSAPGEFQWSLTEDDRLLTIYLAAGQQGEVPILIRGTFGKQGPLAEFPAQIALPRLSVREVARQQGEIAVQADPAFAVEAVELNEHCQQVAPSQLFGWLDAQQQSAARLALHYRQADYAGTLRLSLPEPNVTCETISNVRVTDRAVEETILLDFTIQNAGIRRLSFLLPSSMKDCRLNAPMLRQKKIEEQQDGQSRVTLEFQEDVMGQLRVLVENDRLLKRDQSYAAPIPVVDEKGWRTDRQYVSLQSAGRDEVEIDEPVALEPLSPQQKQWEVLRSKLAGGSITRAYLVIAGDKPPRLKFKTKTREAVQTSGARIGLAEAILVLDSHGAYRAEQSYHVDNTTEQFLEIRLPAGAQLWTAQVAGEPVKPAKVPQAADDRQVRIPLVKTAPGDLDYVVVLRYGGSVRPLGSWGAVGFPLVHTINIKPELSQVRLYVPKTHSWFNFGGTMRQVTEEADLAAGYVAYQTKQTERLVETIRHGNEFAKVRASANVKNVQVQMDAFQSSLNIAQNENLRTELFLNSSRTVAAVQESQQVQQEVQKAAQKSESVDNRERLNVYFSEQKSARAKNTVQELGLNFEDTVSEARPAAVPQGDQVRFNKDWYAANNLDAALPPAEPGKPDARKSLEKRGFAARGGDLTVDPFKASPSPPSDVLIWHQSVSQARANSVNQPAAPEVAQGKAKEQLQESQLSNYGVFDASSAKARDQDRGQVARYQERLQSQQAAPWAAGTYIQAGKIQAGPGGTAMPQTGQPLIAGTTAASSTLQPPAQPGQQLAGQVNITGAGGIDARGAGRMQSAGAGYVRSGSGVTGLLGDNVLPGTGQITGEISGDTTGRSLHFGAFQGDNRAGSLTSSNGAMMPGSGGAKGPASAAQAPAATASVPRPPVTGLASLEVELPVRDGVYEVYRFTTPRGEVEINAWAASRELQSRLSRLAAAAVVLALLLGAVAVVGRGGLSWPGTGHGSTALIALGLLAVLFGIFPIAGMVALAAGAAIKIRRALARRAATAEPAPVQANV